MKTAIFLSAILGSILSGQAWSIPSHHGIETKEVRPDFITNQKKILSFFHNVEQIDFEAHYYGVGLEYSIENNIENYTNKKAVTDFLTLYKNGFLPKYKVFSVFYKRMRDEAIALYKLLYYAKDFDTFYNTAAFARVRLNKDQFVYAFYIACTHRTDTEDFVLPAPYEVYPDFFAHTDVISRASRCKMQDGLMNNGHTFAYGISKEGKDYVFYSNYSNEWNYGHNEHKLSYFTEDVGLNSHYYYFHTYFPFWMKGDEFGVLKQRRGEIYYYFYQQLMARYYVERLANGLGEIPNFSWYQPIKVGYIPYLTYKAYLFTPRNNYYYLNTEDNYDDIKFLNTFEDNFAQYLHKGQFWAYKQEIDFLNPKTINFVGNYWQFNADLYEELGNGDNYRSYEIVARHLLGATPKPLDKHTAAPSALNFYQTSLRDPMFYQLYNKIVKNMMQYKTYLKPYTKDQLIYNGVRISDVHTDELITFYDFYDYDISNRIYKNREEMKLQHSYRYKVRQPRLSHNHFTVTIDIKSDLASEAVFKIFLGPKFNSKGYAISIEDNWMNFYELDWFVQKLSIGHNKIERRCDDFSLFREDSVSVTKIFEYLEQGKLPKDMSGKYFYMPRRLMLPKGTIGGFPLQLFVIVYPYKAPGKFYEPYTYFGDKNPLGFPFDRPVNEAEFIQPNMLFKDILIQFEGEQFSYSLNNPFYLDLKHS